MEYQLVAVRSWWAQIVVGIYSAAIFLVIFFPVQERGILMFNWQYESAAVEFTNCCWPPYIIAAIIFAIPLVIPYMLRRRDAPFARALCVVALFCIVSIPGYLLGSPQNLDSEYFWSYHALAFMVLPSFGVIIGVIAGIYANPPFSSPLAVPSRIQDYQIYQARWQLIRADQDRWWRSTTLFISIVIGILVGAGVAWFSIDIPLEVAEKNVVGYMSARTEQIVLILGLFVVAAMLIVGNMIMRMIRLQRMLEVQYLKLLSSADTSGENASGKEKA